MLQSGGRLSLFEPINRFSAIHTTWDAGPVQELRDRVRAVYLAIQPLDADPMVDLTYQADFEPAEPRSWETVLDASANPRVPTLAEAMAQALTPDEAARYEAYLRPIIERAEGVSRGAAVELWAVKP